MQPKFVIYELNEIPPFVFDYAAEHYAHSAFAEIKRSGSLIRTETVDRGVLSPWITWPTVHRGVSNVQHGITDLNQNLDEPDAKYPPVWEILKNNGLSVGVFGSLHSYKKKIDERYAFYVPDTFAAGAEAAPDGLRTFQQFNLDMVGANPRNVGHGIKLRSAVKFLLRAPFLGIGAMSIYRIIRHLLVEQINKNMVVAR